MLNFDQFIGIDWSGAKSPINTKSIAYASTSRKTNSVTLFQQIRSRQSVCDEILKIKGRTLIGIDCNFGYAHQIVEQQLGKDADAYELWETVEAANKDHPNLFAGEFWSHPKFGKYFWTEGKMPENFQMPKRTTEIRCADNGYGNPESPFKLIGAKQVGKGGLAGMRLAFQLKKLMGDEIAIWPFDQNCGSAKIVMTEIYPRQFIMRAGMGKQKIRTTSDLNKVLKFFDAKKYSDQEFSDHDSDAIISAAGLKFLCGNQREIPENIAHPQSMDKKAQSKEGWIFGVGDQ
ncbi:MAG: hypothetical protein AAF549_01260 [Pseudomonadota bacterium]